MSEKLADTAFLVTWGRAQYVDVSQDPYAHLWLPESVDEFARKFVQQTSEQAAFLWGLRNRYITEKLREFESATQGRFSLINIGSGVTSYPFVLNSNVQHFEIDQANVISYRQDKIDDLVSSGDLPKRNIHFLSIDLNNEIGDLESLIQSQSQPCFFLLEGLLPYLTPQKGEHLLSSCIRLAPPGSRMLRHIFLEDYAISEQMKKIEGFFQNELGLSMPKMSFSRSTDLSLPETSLDEEFDYKGLMKKYALERPILQEDYIDERFYLYSILPRT